MSVQVIMEDVNKTALILKAHPCAPVHLDILLTWTGYLVMTLMNVLLVLHALVTVLT